MSAENPTPSTSRVAVAIPAFNESEGIAEFLLEIDNALSPHASTVLVVVDDCSTDGTADVLETVRSKLEAELVVATTEHNSGHGPALLEAYRRALDTGAQYILAVDGDGQFLGSDLRRLLILLEDGGEGVCGVRRFRYDPWFRMLMTGWLRRYVSSYFGVPTRDANCPLRGYRAELLDGLLRRIPQRSLVPNLFLTILAARRGATLVEVDVNHRVRRGQSDTGTMFVGSSTWMTIRRLLTFSWRAFLESRRFHSDLNSGCPPPHMLAERTLPAMGHDLETTHAQRCVACGGPAVARVDAARSTEAQLRAEVLAPSSDEFGRVAGARVGCTGCGHVWVSDPPPEEVFESAYADVLDEASIREEDGQIATATRDLRRVARWTQPGQLLDVGSWTGSLLVAAERLGWEAVGIEPSDWACAYAERRGCRVRRGTLGSVSLDSEAFSAITLTDVLEHMVDPLGGVRTLISALEPGGVLLVTVPDAGSKLARMLGDRWWSVLPMHLHYFTRRSMSLLLFRGGFEILEIDTHPKVFSVDYYAGRVRAFVPVLGRLVPRLAEGLALADRPVAPDLRDRMLVVARKPHEPNSSTTASARLRA